MSETDSTSPRTAPSSPPPSVPAEASWADALPSETSPSPLGRTSRIERRLLKHVGEAIHRWNLIEEGDRIMVAVSGGKDSLAMLHLLRRLAERAPVHFSLVAVNLDQGQPGFPAETLKRYFESLGIEHRIVFEDTYSIVKRLTEPGKTYCAVCSRLRRGVLYNTAVELGCTKIALGHHREDLIETLLLSALYSGALKSMPPKLVSDDGRNTVIRPLVFCPEAELRAFAEEQRFPVIPCNLCSSQENAQRRRVKQLIGDLAQEHPAVPGNLLNALMHVVPSHLLDASLPGAPAVASDLAPSVEEGAAPAPLPREPEVV